MNKDFLNQYDAIKTAHARKKYEALVDKELGVKVNVDFFKVNCAYTEFVPIEKKYLPRYNAEYLIFEVTYLNSLDPMEETSGIVRFNLEGHDVRYMLKILLGDKDMDTEVLDSAKTIKKFVNQLFFAVKRDWTLTAQPGHRFSEFLENEQIKEFTTFRYLTLPYIPYFEYWSAQGTEKKKLKNQVLVKKEEAREILKLVSGRF